MRDLKDVIAVILEVFVSAPASIRLGLDNVVRPVNGEGCALPRLQWGRQVDAHQRIYHRVGQVLSGPIDDAFHLKSEVAIAMAIRATKRTVRFFVVAVRSALRDVFRVGGKTVLVHVQPQVAQGIGRVVAVGNGRSPG